ncbi:MAG: NAD(P)/FAD-dependent oxidoreductase [Sphingobium sp.]
MRSQSLFARTTAGRGESGLRSGKACCRTDQILLGLMAIPSSTSADVATHLNIRDNEMESTLKRPDVASDRPAKWQPRVVIIGSGVAGIACAIKLKAQGIDDIVILEKAGKLGGTWRDNRYPGLACDVPAHLYVYSFRPNPNWKRRFAEGPDIWRYYSGVAAEYGVTEHIAYNEEVLSAEWTGRHWLIRTSGPSKMLEADILISAVGRLQHPKYPDIAGLDDFGGQVFHSARWPDGVGVKGKRVGIIGTGSTATQLTTALAPVVDRLTIFQRTPQWVLTIPNPGYSWVRRALYRAFPALHERYLAKLRQESRAAVELITGKDRSFIRSMCEAGLASVEDPVLRDKLRPDYEPGCKRIVMSPNFYQAVQGDNVELVTDAIERAEGQGVRTADGRLHELDILVLATGFKTDAFMRPMSLSGANGTKLDDIWDSGFLNYKSVALPEMPNFFMINGPYSPGGNASVVGIIETHVNFIIQCIDRIRERHVALMPDRRTTEKLLAAVREAAKNTIWAQGGCSSWYLDKEGVPLINPLSIDQLRADMREPAFDDFVEVEIDGAGREAVMRQ